MNRTKEVEKVPMSFAPTQARGVRFMSGTGTASLSLMCAALGAMSIYWGEGPSIAFMFSMSLILGSFTAFVWSNHLRAIHRVAQEFDGVKYLFFGAYKCAASDELGKGQKISQGFVLLKPGVLEIRTGHEAHIVATYSSGQLARATVLRVMGGFLEPVARLAFTDGVTYDFRLDEPGPKGRLALGKNRLHEFIADVRTALTPIATAAQGASPSSALGNPTIRIMKDGPRNGER